MRTGEVTIHGQFTLNNTEDLQRRDVLFVFRLSKWEEIVPYGSTSARLPCSDIECVGIFVEGKPFTEDGLKEFTGGGFSDSDWDWLESAALEKFEDEY